VVDTLLFTTTTVGELFFASTAPTRNPHPSTTNTFASTARHGAKRAATEEKVMHKQMRIPTVARMAQQQQQQITPTAIPAVGLTGAVPLL
jgi:hypothetical protein